MNSEIHILIRIIDFVFSGHCQAVIHTPDAIIKLERYNVSETQEVRDMRQNRGRAESTD